MDNLEQTHAEWLDALKQEEEAHAKFRAVSSRMAEYEWLKQSRLRVSMARNAYLNALHKSTEPSESPEPSPLEQ